MRACQHFSKGVRTVATFRKTRLSLWHFTTRAPATPFKEKADKLKC